MSAKGARREHITLLLYLALWCYCMGWTSLTEPHSEARAYAFMGATFASGLMLGRVIQRWLYKSDARVRQKEGSR